MNRPSKYGNTKVTVDGMTPRQQDVFDFIARHLVESGYSPSLREIADGVGLKNAASVSLHIRILLAAGHLRRLGSCGPLALPSRKEFYMVGPYEMRGLGHPWPPLIKLSSHV